MLTLVWVLMLTGVGIDFDPGVDVHADCGVGTDVDPGVGVHVDCGVGMRCLTWVWASRV